MSIQRHNLALNSGSNNTEIDKKVFIEAVQLYVRLNRSDNNWHAGYCPFCSNIDRTFIVNSELLTWECTSCSEKGDIYHLIHKVKGRSRDWAIRFVDSLYDSILTSIESSPTILHGDLDVRKAKHDKTALFPPEPDNTKNQKEDNKGIQTNNSILQEQKDQLIPKTVSIKQVAANTNELAGIIFENFNEASGFHGIAIVDQEADSQNILMNSMDGLSEKDVSILTVYLKTILKYITSLFGDFSELNGDTSICMFFELRTVRLKLVWVPFNWRQSNVGVFLLLDLLSGEAMPILQLKKMLKQ